MDKLPAIMLDEEEHVDDPIPDGLDNQQIGRPYPSKFVGQERPPSLGAARCWLPPPIATDRRLETTMPSLSSSPRIRSLPQSGLSRDMVAMRSRTSALRRGRPSRVRDFHVQYSLQPLRCQRSTVSGSTMWR